MSTLSDFFGRFRFFRSNFNEPKDERVHSVTDPIDPEDYDVNFQKLQDYVRDEMSDGMNNGAFGSFDYMSWISMVEKSKDDRISLYREMEQNAYVSEGLDEIVYSAYNEDEMGEPLTLKIKNKNLAVNENIRENLRREFEHVMKNVIDYKKNFLKWFREFVLMGEYGVEAIIDEDDGDIRKNGVKKVKFLHSEEFVCKYLPDGTLDAFIIRNMWNQNSRVLADTTQVAYTDSGKYDFIEGVYPSYAQRYVTAGPNVLRLPKSFIHDARKPYKQLDALEDSLVIGRLSRAPNRLVFNIATGNLPKNKAEQYLTKIINKYRKKLTYNPDTGEVDQTQNVKNIIEDFWFVKDNSGRGTDVTTLEQNSNFGDIDDVNFFVQKLYKAMKVPYARYTGESASEQGMGMNRDEVKFEKFVYSIVQMFIRPIKEVYFTHLKLKGIWDHYHLSEKDMEIDAVPPSYFSYMKNSEVLEAQFARFANFVNNTDVESPIFSRYTALKDGLGWSDDKIKDNEERLKQEQTKVGGEEGEEGMGGDMGGDLGGGGLGGDMGADLGAGGAEGGLEI
jgi:hypothetical protein